MRRGKELKLRKTLFIFCEGETEKCYFEALKEIKRDNINIKIETFKIGQLGTTKEKILKDISRIYLTIDYEFGFTNKKLKSNNSKIYVLLDTDAYTKNNISTIQSTCLKKGIDVLFSNQDIELFILLHLENFTGTSNNYIKLIKAYYPNYEKGCCSTRRKIHKDIIEKNINNLKTSIDILNKKHIGKLNIKDKLPFSEVYRIYDDIL